MDSDEIARHIKEQEHKGKRGVLDAEAPREKSKTLRNVQELAKYEDFEGFSRMLDTLNVKDVERRRVAVAQFYQMVSDYKKKGHRKPRR
jgi:NADH:ubiquinone oxidoreductase subunit E